MGDVKCVRNAYLFKKRWKKSVKNIMLLINKSQNTKWHLPISTNDCK